MKKKFMQLIIFLSFIQIGFSQSGNTKNIYNTVLAEIEYKNYDKAIDLLTNAIKTDKKNHTLYYKRAEIFYIQQRFNNAIADYLICEKIKENSVSYELAECYAQLNNSKQSVYYLEKYLKQSFKKLKAEIKNNETFQKIENSNEWKNLWKKDHYSQFENLLSEAEYCSRNNKTEDAFQIYDKLISKSKNNPQVYYYRALLYDKNNDYSKALKDINKAVKLRTGNTIYIEERAKMYFKSKKYEKALIDYIELLKFTNNYKYYYKTAQCNFELNNNEEAIENINQYISFYYNDTEAFYLFGNINYKQEKYMQALEYFNKCIEAKPEVKYYEARANTFYEMKLYNQAGKDYSMYLDLNPRNGEIYYKKGNTEYYSGNTNQACFYWERAKSLKFYKADKMLSVYCK